MAGPDVLTAEAVGGVCQYKIDPNAPPVAPCRLAVLSIFCVRLMGLVSLQKPRPLTPGRNPGRDGFGQRLRGDYPQRSVQATPPQAVRQPRDRPQGLTDPSMSPPMGLVVTGEAVRRRPPPTTYQESSVKPHGDRHPDVSLYCRPSIDWPSGVH